MRSRRGFSLVEFALVLALIGLIVSIVTISARSVMTRGKQDAARAELSTLAIATETFFTAEGRYPTTAEGLALLAKSSEKFAEPLLPRVPTDPWGRPYGYLSPARGHAYDIVCYGADGRPGGTGADADISCWDVQRGPQPKK